MEPVVSIVIPTFNEEKYIGDTINRLTQQTSWPWSEIVIADYDPDKKGKTINAILNNCDERTLDNVVHIPVDKSGIGYARNIGCVAARGRFLVTFDADARFAEPNAIDHLIRPLMNNQYVITHCVNTLKPEEANINNNTSIANSLYAIRSRVINNISPVMVFEQGMTFTKNGYMSTSGFPDVVVGEGVLLSWKFIFLYGANRILQLNNVTVESSSRRAKGGTILDVNYNNAYR